MNASGVRRDDRIEASQLKGSPVFTAGGDLIGTIQDVVIDVADGRIAEVIVWFGTASGAQASYYSLPWSALSLTDEGPGYVADPGAARPLEVPDEGEKLMPDGAPGEEGRAAGGTRRGTGDGGAPAG